MLNSMMEAASPGWERAPGHLRPLVEFASTGETSNHLPGPVISHPPDPSGILSIVKKPEAELKPLVLRVELTRCNVSLFTEWG